MESIVSPWIIYLLGVLGNLNIILGGVFLIICIVLAVLVIIAIIAICGGNSDDVADFLTKIKFVHYFALGCVLSLCLLTPTKEVVIGMYVDNEITYDRAEKAVEIGKDIIQEVTKEETAQGIDIDDIYIVYSKKEYVKQYNGIFELGLMCMAGNEHSFNLPDGGEEIFRVYKTLEERADYCRETYAKKDSK